MKVLLRWVITLPRAGAGRGVSPFARLSQITAPPGPCAPPPATMPLTMATDRAGAARTVASVGAAAWTGGDGVRGGDAGGGGRGRRTPSGCALSRASGRISLSSSGSSPLHPEQRLPLGGGGREVAAVPGQLSARQQIEDQVLLLGGGLDREILRPCARPAAAAAPRRATPGPCPGRGAPPASAGADDRARQQRHRSENVVASDRPHQLYTSDVVSTLLATVGAPASSRFDQPLALENHRLPEIEAQAAGEPIDGDRREALEPGVAPIVAAVHGELAQRAEPDPAADRRRAGRSRRARETPTTNGNVPSGVVLRPPRRPGRRRRIPR